MHLRRTFGCGAFETGLSVPRRTGRRCALPKRDQRGAYSGDIDPGALSPALVRALLAASFQGWPLVICGALKITYDLLLLAQFRHVKPPEER